MKYRNHNEAITQDFQIPLLESCDPKNSDGFFCAEGSAVFVKKFPPDLLTRNLSSPEYNELPVTLSRVSLGERHKKQTYAALQGLPEVPLLIALADFMGVNNFQAGIQRVIATWLSFPGESASEPYRKAMQRSLSRRSRTEPTRLLLDEVNKGLSIAGGIRFVVWQEKSGHLLPGLLCPDSRAALFAMAFYHIGRPGGLGYCKRPSCGSFFVRVRKTQKYCSFRCESADKQARYRMAKNQRLENKREGKAYGKESRRRRLQAQG